MKMSRFTYCAHAVIALGASLYCACAQSADVIPDAQHAAAKTAAEVCGSCHGANGRSVSPTFPNLAGQTVQYLETQLKAFKDQSRADPDAQAYMWGMAAQLSDGMISALAAYFSGQPPAPPTRSGDPALIAKGKRLFEEGVPARQIPPCASCHGSHAEGQVVFPRLAGQHAPYLFKQLLVIQNVLRTAPVMHGVIKDLTKDQMQSVVAYLESI
ncbi:MAG: c-type cytochrome [Steroidobacteraceae bacterium]